MARIEEVIKMIYGQYREKHNQPASHCPDEGALACFSEGKLSGNDSENIQKHLVTCSRCCEIVALFFQRPQDQHEVPEPLIQKIKGLIKEGSVPKILEIALALKKTALQILNTTGDVILDNEIVPLPVLRSRQISEFSESIKLLKEFEDIKITIQIQKQGDDKIRISLSLVNKANFEPLADLRLALIKGDSELESYETLSGSGVFDRLGIGHYAIDIYYKNNKFGVIDIEIK
ncbi:MAG: hypothetical protein ABIC18_02760 [Candidatus Omnitrophota bacterium]